MVENNVKFDQRNCLLLNVLNKIYAQGLGNTYAINFNGKR